MTHPETIDCVLLADRHHGLSEGVRSLLETTFKAVVMVADEVSLFESAKRLPVALAVVLAAGGFPNDVQRRKALFPRTPTGLEHLALPPQSCSGDGITLGDDDKSALAFGLGQIVARRLARPQTRYFLHIAPEALAVSIGTRGPLGILHKLRRDRRRPCRPSISSPGSSS